MTPQEPVDNSNPCLAVRRHIERMRRHGRGVVALTLQARGAIQRWRVEHERRPGSGAASSRRV